MYKGLKNNSFDRDYIGFATLPEQIHRKSVKRGFDFTLMVVGESGLGKSTMVNSLFLGDLYKNRVVPNAAEKLERTTRIEKKSMEIEEKGVRLRLTIVDTPGFGDSTNCEESWRSCISYIDDQVGFFRAFVCVFLLYSPLFCLYPNSIDSISPTRVAWIVVTSKTIVYIAVYTFCHHTDTAYVKWISMFCDDYTKKSILF